MIRRAECTCGQSLAYVIPVDEELRAAVERGMREAIRDHLEVCTGGRMSERTLTDEEWRSL